MTATLYCYFKAPSEREAVLDRFRALQRELAAAGWTGELLRRCDDADTWMEVYPGISDRDAFRSAWQSARLRHGLALPASEEWFQPL
ncbi:DUF4936 family protein [Chromobacterium violaceum]|uniref:DUF4936 family protein n=1 Tax=Chromobacterium violaceum TaxID=536 RepID=UPI0019511E72|nr:DUF4936 family protein [Chromobacterium violaceum]QRO33026.1 DUF4936 family protein [Chromobacterium violaceum]QRQ17173.1 DUF4936 family protein [Chromobacterium violaceum]